MLYYAIHLMLRPMLYVATFGYFMLSFVIFCYMLLCDAVLCYLLLSFAITCKLLSGDIRVIASSI